MSGRGTVHTMGALAPSQRMTTVPVTAATSARSRRPALLHLAVTYPAPAEKVHAGAKRLVLRPLEPPRLLRQAREREHCAVARGTTYARTRPPDLDERGVLPVAGRVPATRAWIESSAARGMLSSGPPTPPAAERRSVREPFVERAARGGTRGSARGELERRRGIGRRPYVQMARDHLNVRRTTAA